MRYIVLAALAALSFATAQQKDMLPYPEQLAAFRAQAEQLGKALYAANAALEAAQETAGAHAAAPLVLAVHAENARMSTVTRELEQAGATVTELFSKGKLRQTLRHLPIGRFNELRDELLSKKCHGSVQLYLALTNRNAQFSEAQVAAPLNETQSATLRTVSEVFDLLRNNTDMRRWKTEAEFDRKLLALIDKAQPGIEGLQQNPTALMQFDALVVSARPELQLLYERNFYELGDLEERLMRRPDNFFAELYSDYYRKTYFASRYHHSNNPSIHKLIQSRWEAAAPTLAEFRKKHNLGEGDGRTPETAFSFPPHINRSNYLEFLNEFSRCVFGDDALYVQAPRIPQQNKFGKRIVWALAYGGRLQEPHLNEIHLIYCYFYLPK